MTELDHTCDVVVSGAGPVGLLLAAELALHDVDVVLLERRTEPDQMTKAGVLGPLAVEALCRRGLGPELASAEAGRRRQEQLSGTGPVTVDRRPRTGPTNHFAGLEQLRPDCLPTRDRRRMAVDQLTLERILTGHAERLGVVARRGRELVALDQDVDGVRVEVRTPDGAERIRARYLVGCDGGHSAVRTLTGIEFVGTGPTLTGRQGVVRLSDPSSLRKGWQRSSGGMVAFGLGVNRVFTVEFDGGTRSSEPVSRDELEQSLQRALGHRVELDDVRNTARFSDTTRQAARYRDGRVFLAGDAAHVHPPFGAQGLNVGLMDATNLGWKLARALADDGADPALLDTYEIERHPAGQRLLENTRAQIALMRVDPHSSALRALFSELMNCDQVNERLWNLLTDLDERYPTAEGHHPLVGRPCPSWRLRTAGRSSTLAELAADGRALLLQLSGDRLSGSGVGGGREDRVGVHDVRIDDVPELAGVDAMLVRPDGFVAWAGRTNSARELAGLSAQLRRWTGRPRPVAEALAHS